MRNIIKLLRNHVGTILVILALLVLEAWCDLALPSYTSDIVDVGIQQSGISDTLPEKLRPESLKLLTLFMDEDDAALVQAHYTQEDGLVLQDGLSSAKRAQLADAFSLPMALCYQAQERGTFDLNLLPAALESGQLTQEQLLALRDEATTQMTEVSDTMLRQVAVEYMKEEYTALGMDLEAMQRGYLLLSGAKMLGVTLLSVLSVIIITLLASRTAAAVSRDLRERVFTHVLSFSSAEMDRFSTASLITRSTNDIQQVQMVIVMLLRMVLYAPILGIGGILKVANTRTGLGWIIAVAVSCLLAVVLVLVAVAMPKFKRMQSLVDDLNLVSREILTGLPVIRAFSRERFEKAHFDKANTNLKNNQLFVNRPWPSCIP